ncbi:MAG: GumC family protein, partial [Sphingomonadaceae bacterium]|nr:GumC family protein [Sphingomonadaceae bacterium]
MNRQNFEAFQPLATPPNGDRPRDDSTPPILAHYWHLLREHWKAVAIICALALLAGLVSVLLSTRLYTAETRVEITRPTDNVTQVEGVQGDDYLQNLEFYETQYALLEADSLGLRVANALQLAQDDAFFAMHGVDPEARYAELPALLQNSTTALAFRQELAAELLLERLRIRPVKGSALVDVLYSSPDPKFSARVANAWVEQFVEAGLARRFSSSERARAFLETRLAALKEKLEDSERQLVAYAGQTGIVPLAESKDSEGRTLAGRTVATADLEALNAALASATARRIEAEARYRQGDIAEAGSAESQALAALRREKALAEARYAELMTRFEPGYPEARATAEQVATLNRAIAREESRERSGAAAEYRAAAQQEAALKARVQGLKSQVTAERGDSIQYSIYQREVDTNRALYEALLQRYKELGVSDIDKSNVAVIDAAAIPRFPSSPRAPVNLGLSLLAGLAMAGGFIFLRTNLDRTLRDPAKVEELFGAPLLGAIPLAESDSPLEELADRKSAIHEAWLAMRSNLELLTGD